MPSPLLRRENKIKILRYILKNGKTTRNQLASNLNLAHSTLSYIIDELLDEGFLVFEEIRKRRGRPYQILKVNPEKFTAIGVKVGREEVRGVLFDASMNPLKEHRVQILSGMRNNDGYTRALRETIEQLHSENLLGVGICSSGIVKEGKVIVSHVMNVKDWDPRKVLKDLERILVMNDSDALCREISQRVNADFLLVSYGIGIGASLWKDKRIHHLEMGHMLASSEGKCYCGQTGCLEYHSSEYAVLKSCLGKEIDFEDFITSEEEKYRQTIEELREKARKDFDSVKVHYEKAFKTFSVVLGNVIMGSGVSRVFFAGEGVVNEEMIKILEEMVRARFNRDFVGEVQFQVANANWMLGAARAVVDKYLPYIVK
ncbi:MAG: ROK family protein [Thermotoga petrophila]|uniref:ROK family protein n=1 Tax=Thermotoga petrophila TaxID=93929 RepID=A0A101ERR7_9THEM|nr:MAG: ROK family protein [Thermotoga petrophila]